MTKFRSRLGLLMLLHTLVAFLAADAADPAIEAGLFAVGRAPSVPVVAMFFAWVVYELLDLPDVLSLIPGLGPKDELSRSGIPTCLIWARRASRMACQCSPWRPAPHRHRGHDGQRNGSALWQPDSTGTASKGAVMGEDGEDDDDDPFELVDFVNAPEAVMTGGRVPTVAVR